MVISDHLNFMGVNPSCGAPMTNVLDRAFQDMSEVYSRELQELVIE